MKRFLCILVIVSLCLSMSVYAEGAEKNPLNVKCNLNSASVVIDGKQLNMHTLTYKNMVYVPVSEISGLFKSNFKLDEKNKILNIITSGKAAAVNLPKVKPAKKMNQTISAELNRYNVQVDGLNEHMESITYNKAIYVPIRFFSEVFDKDVQPKADGRIMINSKKNIVSTVNGENISKWEYDYYYNVEVKEIESNESADKEKQKEDLKKDLLSYIANLKIISQKSREQNVSLDTAEISNLNASIDSMVSNNGGIENFRKMLSGYGLYFHHTVLKLKEESLRNKLFLKVVENVAATDDEMKKYYEDNKASFTDQEKVRAKHILISILDESGKPLDENKKSEAKAKAEDLLNQIKKGGNFDELMKANSQDPGLASKPDGYTFAKGDMMKEFEDAAFALSPGEVSGIVETAYGYHIIKLEEKIPSKVSTYDEVKTYIKGIIDNQKKQDYANQLLDKWKSESKIVNKI